jgi:adenylate cyclase
MTTKALLEQCVDNIFSINWDVRDGQVVPQTEGVALKNGAVKLEAAFLYADLAASSKLAEVCPWTTTAKIIRAYLDCAVRSINAWGGSVRSFDGDRVMGVFVGDMKNTHATNCAREIFYAVDQIIAPKSTKNFKSISDNNIIIQNCIGVDVGECRAVRAGIRNSNDLIWIGKAPSFAAKLSDIRDYPRSVYISSRTYAKLSDDSKIFDGANIWTKGVTQFAGATETVYGTRFMKIP